MNLEHFTYQFLAIALGGGISVSIAYFLFKKDLNRYFYTQTKPQKKSNNKHLLSLRLQAHERLIIFIDRINPTNLLIRLYHKEIPLRDFQSIILNEVRNEYQHNITQQLYINSETWKVIKNLKDDTLTMINNAVQSLDNDAKASDLNKKILQNMAQMKDSPYDLTIDLLKQSFNQTL